MVSDSTITTGVFGLPQYDELNIVPDCLLSNIGLYSFIIAAITIGLFLVLSYLTDKTYKRIDNVANRYLSIGFIFVWIFGFMTYDVGMYTGNPWSLFGNAPMAIIHSFGMFIFESDVSAIHEPFHNNWVFMFCFSLAHLFAAIVSLAFVLKYFGYNIVSSFRRFSSRWHSKDTTYIFWGMNDGTYYLAKDIIRQQGENKNYRMIVVRTSKDNEADASKNGMERLFNFLSLRSRDLDRLKELSCLTTNSFSDLSAVDPTDGQNSNILLEELRLSYICHIIKKMTRKDIHIFFLSENEEANINAIVNLEHDLTIQKFLSDKSHKMIFYCHARFNSVHRVIEDEQLAKNAEVRVVDSSHISVESLKRNVDLQPVSFVDIEKDATVSSPFNSLIIGFSEVGADAVRFLYEFGAFVKSGSTDDNVQRSPFHCHIVDKQMKSVGGPFVYNSPAVDVAETSSDDSDQLITMHQMDCNSINFYKSVERWIKDGLNYVVVCTDSDELNIAVAVRIFKMSIRYRKNMRHLCILVRIHNDDNGQIHRIAEHYNRLWKAEMSSTGNKRHQKQIKKNEKVDMPICLFGLPEETYTYVNIISEQLVTDAANYKKMYDESIKAIDGSYRIQSWDEEQNDLMQNTGEYAAYSPTYTGVMRLRRTQSQNLSNSLHIYTKQKLAYSALGENLYAEFADHHLSRKLNETNYTWAAGTNPKPQLNRVLDVLAQTEHLRWNASHEMLGYMSAGDECFQDEERQLHGCLKDWQNLSTIVKSYDYNVVDVSLGIIDNNRLAIKNKYET